VNMPVDDAPAAGAISEGGTELTIKSLTTENPRWCPGCGDFGILMALKRFMVNEHMEPAETVHVSGIGCSSTGSTGAPFPSLLAWR
jgi:pyruvate/2-oxoacid:ferredoxin oxidoreductase beta subunit